MVFPWLFFLCLAESQHRLRLYATAEAVRQPLTAGRAEALHPLLRKEHHMKTKRLNFRLADWQDDIIRAKAQEANMSITDYVIRCAMEKKIINYEGIEALETQLKKIGNNLNQIVVIARQGRAEIFNLESVQQELAALHETLLQQLQKMEI